MSMSDPFDTGDCILDKRSRQRFEISCAHDDWIHTLGFPEMRLRTCDVELVRKATPEQRMEQIKILASSSHDGHRPRCARARLIEMQECVGDADG